jgi:predicted phage-related endonuclease
MDGFSQAERAAAWWATDSRRAVSGHLMDVILEKRGEKERADLSEVEAVQMGLIMQPTIAQIFTEQTKINTRPLDIAGTHRQHEWLRSHFDFLCEDGGLLEVKNFNASVINKYSEPDEPIKLPEADYVQCLHEATVYGCSHVYFAVLFGGQRFRYWKLEFTDAEKEAFIQRAAQWWAYIHSHTLPPAENTEHLKILHQQDNGHVVTATAQIENACEVLRRIKAQMTALEEAEEKTKFIIQNFMADKAELVSVAGDTLATWKTSKASKKFDAKAMEKEIPETYKRYLRDAPGSRRFLLK